MMQDAKIKRLLIVSVILVFICIICIFISVRSVEKYRNKVIETTALEQKLDNLEQYARNLDIKIKELEARRHALSLEKEQISKDYAAIKVKYASLGKTIKILKRDMGTLQRVMKTSEEIEEESDEVDKDVSDLALRLEALQNQNDELLKELTRKTKEKMILEIAFEAQAKRLGLSERYDPDLKETIKDFVTSLQ
ncbi:MAG: hypothetical protein JYX80_07850 [Candidatus Scalindua sediminis]|nr:hypothetical protein [Candidatus Scalindua sediminis]